MTTIEMIDLIRAGRSAMSRRALVEIADRLEEQDGYLRSALRTLSSQEEQLRNMGGELAECDRFRKAVASQYAEMLTRCDVLEAALSCMEGQQ